LNLSDRLGAALAAALLLLLLSPVAYAEPLALLGAVTLPTGLTVDGTLVGGLSGLSYDPDAGRWYAISDDRAEHGPARIYTLAPRLEAGRLAALDITGVIELRTIAGTPFQRPARDRRPDPGTYADPEAVAYDPSSRTLYWTTEGSWVLDSEPRLSEARLDGMTLRVLPTPSAARYGAGHATGPRDNADFEAMGLVPGGPGLWLGVERPLIQDGGLPTQDSGAPVRLSLLDRHSGRLLRQVAYELSPRQGPPGAREDTPGLAELAVLDGTRLLTLERSYVEGVGTFVQIFLADTGRADDIAALPALADERFALVAKRLLVDLRRLGVPMDNYEGLALGPVLPDGRRLLLVCSDDNFSPAQKTIFLAFAADVRELLSGP
jgi:hypothetical protein